MDLLYLSIFYFFLTLIRCTPPFMQRLYAKGIGFCAYKLDSKHRNIIKINLRVCFPEKDEAFIEQTCKKVYENFASYALDFLDNYKGSKKRVAAKVDFINEEVLQGVLKTNKSLIISTAHLSNWELLGLNLGLKFKIHIIGRALESKPMNEILDEGRAAFNNSLIDKKGGAKKIIKALKDGEAIGILCDQDALDSESMQLEFFSQKVNFINAASIMGKRCQSVLLPTYIYKEDGIYKIFFYPPKDCEKCSVEELTLYQAKCTQEMIARYPEQYFFFHRRFKRYNLGLYERKA